MPTWAEENRNDPDRGIKEYSTARRWDQYQAGEITREKAVELATKRTFKEIDKETAEKINRLDNVAAAPVFGYASISVPWARSRTWGYNPTAEVLHIGDRRTEGHASGCGYDKESAAVASALNKNPAALRVLYELGEKALMNGKSPNSKTACTGYNWCDCVGYGSGYGVLPYFEGGVGVNCFWHIFEKAGYEVRCAGSGKMYDCYTIERTWA